MTEFTEEFIATARKLLTENPWKHSIIIPVQLEMLDHIERLQARVAELENSQVQEYHVPPESFNDLMEIFRQGTKDGTIIIKNLTTSNAGLKQKKIEQLEEIIQASRNRIAELEEQQRWIPVSESLPEDQEFVIILYKGVVDVTSYHADGFAHTFDHVTHWQELPQPPESEEE